MFGSRQVLKPLHYRKVLLTFLAFIVSIGVNADGIVIGDVNNDGRMSIADITLFVNQLIEGESPSQYSQSADLNLDSRIDIADLNRLSNIITRQSETNADTLYLYFHHDDVFILNPFLSDEVSVVVPRGSADVFVTGHSCFRLITSARGESANGRLYIDSDQEYVFNLQGLILTSQNAPAFNSVSDKKVKVELANNTENSFTDAQRYSLPEGETASGCFNSMGQLTFMGNGCIQVTGNNKHAIYCKKSINIDGGTILVGQAKSDALHSGKHITINGGKLNLKGMDGDAIDLDDNFTMTSGSLTMDIKGEASKGVKCGGNMTISGGAIIATASGAMKNKNGDLSYCINLKCDSCAVVKGGEFNLTNSSPGGKCLSVGKNLTIEGGTFTLETSGDGAEYTNAQGQTDYYTSKCVVVDDSLKLHRGALQCLSTGIGGKGIVTEKYMEIGDSADKSIEQGPEITVNTTGTSIVNDVDEDQRYGCPKAVKVNQILKIYSGDIHCNTSGVGGEGIECNKEMYVYGGNIECDCFDDGINVGGKLDIYGGSLYCNSIDNDGIDSNGKITITGGIVVALNQGQNNESFDSENYSLYIYGGTVFGVGRQRVHLQECTYPCYNTIGRYSAGAGGESDITIEKDKYIYVMHGDSLLMALNSTVDTAKGFITISDEQLIANDSYQVLLGDRPMSPVKSYFNSKFTIGGTPVNSVPIFTFIAQ